MKKDKNPDTLAVIKNYNFCDKHTHRQTDGQRNALIDPAQRAELVKVKIFFRRPVSLGRGGGAELVKKKTRQKKRNTIFFFL